MANIFKKLPLVTALIFGIFTLIVLLWFFLFILSPQDLGLGGMAQDFYKILLSFAVGISSIPIFYIYFRRETFWNGVTSAVALMVTFITINVLAMLLGGPKVLNFYKSLLW